MKKKSTAGVLALLFGHFGVHRFYLGQQKLGRIYLIATLVLFLGSVRNDAPLVLLMPLIGLIDAILFFSMPKEDFDEKYNEKHLQQSRHQAPAAQLPMARSFQVPVTGATTEFSHKAAGIQKFRDFDFEGAATAFKKALEQKFDDPAVHFNLACCYSLLERPDPAFFHLGKAVHFGFVDFDKIEQHDGLAYLRALPAFRQFVNNGYQHAVRPLDLPAEPMLAEVPAPDLLAQMKKLEDLRQQGILTEEEYRKMVGQ